MVGVRRCSVSEAKAPRRVGRALLGADSRVRSTSPRRGHVRAAARSCRSAWLDLRRELPVGSLLCVIHGPTRGRLWSPAAARAELRRTAAAAGVRRRFAPHQLRHAHAVEMAREGVPLIVIQRQLGHSNLGITSVCLQGIDSGEIIETVRARRAHDPRQRVAATLMECKPGTARRAKQQ
jgi:integrase